MADVDDDLHESALAALSRRALTATELRKRLLAKGFAPAAVDAELERLERVRLVDDRSVAYNSARWRAEEGRRGPARVVAELRARGIDPALAREAVESEFPREAEADALLTAYRRLVRGGPPRDRKERDRVARRLIRDGFPPGRVFDLLNTGDPDADLAPDFDQDHGDPDAIE